MDQIAGTFLVVGYFVPPLVLLIALSCWLCPKAEKRVWPWVIVAFIPIVNFFAPWILLAQAVGVALDRTEHEWEPEDEWEPDDQGSLRE